MQTISAGLVKGIDVSHYNGDIDWKQVKDAGYSFVYVKSTEGISYDDPGYVDRAKGALQAGLHCGAYHFARPSATNSAVAEAKHFCTWHNKVAFDLKPVLDLEYSRLSASETVQWALDFISHVKSEINKDVILYTGEWFMNPFGAEADKLAHIPLWISYYSPSAPPDLAKWNEWTIWQFSETGSCPGVNGQVDLNVAVSLDAILAKKPQPKIVPAVQKPKHAPAPKFIRVLKLNNPYLTGEDVKILQKRLNIPADGIYGSQTADSVRQWQELHDASGKVVRRGTGLVPDSICGVKTWKALFPDN